jgi:hypothetical protein
LTRAGQQLTNVCGARPVDGFFDLVRDHWAKRYPVSVKQMAPTSINSTGN